MNFMRNFCLCNIDDGTAYTEKDSAKKSVVATGYRLHHHEADDKIYCLKGDQTGKKVDVDCNLNLQADLCS